MDKITSILTGALTIAAGYVIASLVVSKMSATTSSTAPAGKDANVGM